MIYKFKFEVCTDDNIITNSKSEESGNFWWAFATFMRYVMDYVAYHRMHE